MRLTIATVLSALALTLTPASPATAADEGGPLQHPLQLDRGAEPRVLSMVGNRIRFADGRTVAFEPPAGVTGQARLIGRHRDDAVVWAPYGKDRTGVFTVRPSGRVTMLGDPWLDLYGDNDWQIAGNVLYVAAYDARSRTRLTKVSLVDGSVRRSWISAKSQIWSLLSVTPHRAAIGNGDVLRVWERDGGFERVFVGAGRRYGDVSFASLRHDWFARRTGNGTELRRISTPSKVVWKQGYENEMIPFDISGDGSVLLTTEYETYSPQLRDARTGKVLRSYQGGYQDAFNDNEQLVLEGSRAFLVVMNLRIDGKHKEVLVRCTMGGTCERASRVASSITLVTYGS